LLRKSSPAGAAAEGGSAALGLVVTEMHLPHLKSRRNNIE